MSALHTETGRTGRNDDDSPSVSEEQGRIDGVHKDSVGLNGNRSSMAKDPSWENTGPG